MTAMGTARAACPDDPIADIHQHALREVRIIAAEATQADPGNIQLAHLVIKVGDADTVARARSLVAGALLKHKSKTNRPLQDFCLDAINRLRGL